jgi:MinD-like ATPase involved in chromosome partitioning or flagellar assembly
VNRDDTVRQSLLEKRPVVEARPRSDASVYVRRIARKLEELRP